MENSSDKPTTSVKLSWMLDGDLVEELLFFNEKGEAVEKDPSIDEEDEPVPQPDEEKKLFDFEHQLLQICLNDALGTIQILMCKAQLDSTPLKNNYPVYKTINERFGEEVQYEHFPMTERKKRYFDLAMIHSILYKTLEDLTFRSNFSSLVNAAKILHKLKREEKILSEEMIDSVHMESHLRKKIADQTVKLNAKYNAKYKEYRDLISEHRVASGYYKMEQNYLNEWEIARRNQGRLKLNRNESYYTDIISSFTEKTIFENRIHDNIIAYIEENTKDLNQEIEKLVTNYDDEIERRDAQIAKLKISTSHMMDKYVALQAQYNQHKYLIEYWEQLKIKILRENMLRVQQIWAARIIQAMLLALLAQIYECFKQLCYISDQARMDLLGSLATSTILHKYIYIESLSAKIPVNKYHFVNGCNKNFLVYIVTVSNECQTNQLNEGDQYKQNGIPKSYTLPDVNKINKSCHLITKSEKSLTRRLFKSKIPVSTSKSSLHSEKEKKQFSRKHNSTNNLTQAWKEGIQTKTQKGYEIFKKFIGHMHKGKPSNNSSSSVEEIFIRDCSLEKPSAVNEKDLELVKYTFPTSHIADCSQHEILHEIMELANKLHDSEVHVKDILVKYIQDKSLESELVNSICGYGKLLLESEHRTLQVSNETWLHQTEVYKEQLKTHQTMLNSVIHQNRDLQLEIEALTKKNEKMSAKMFIGNDPLAYRSPPTATKRIIEDLNRNNDKLRLKLNGAVNQMSDLEATLKKAQKKIASLQQQLSNSSTQLQNNKMSFERSKANFELEIAKLMNELHSKTVLAKESIEAGGILLTDIDSVRSQCGTLCKAIDWSKFNTSEKSLASMIHMGRTCINELNRQLVDMTNKNALQSQEIENLKQSNKMHEEQIESLLIEKEKLNNLVVENEKTEIGVINIQKRLIEMEDKLTYAEMLVSQKSNDLKEKDSRIDECNGQILTLKREIIAKEESAKQAEADMAKVLEEKETLRSQLNGMIQVIAATGVGDITKELVAVQDKLGALQEQYYAVVAEKDSLQKQISTYGDEKQTLDSHHKTTVEQIKLVQKELQSSLKVNEGLKEQVQTQQQTISALQAERVRHLQEKTILTAIYERLKSEILKMDRLEGAFNKVNAKANKLAMIAEYNKEIGQKLQSEVAERDVAISELQDNVKKLSSIQLASTKQKAELCEELGGILAVKEVLKYKLCAEIERNEELGTSKKEIENFANNQLQTIQAMYDKEHNTLRQLLDDVKILVGQKELLEVQNREYSTKIETLIGEKMYLANSNEDLAEKVKLSEQKMIEMTEEFEQKKSKLFDDIKKYKRNAAFKQDALKQLLLKTSELENNVEYLKNTQTRMRFEVDQVRESEIKQKKLLEQEKNDSKLLREELKEAGQKVAEMEEDIDMLREQLEKMREMYEDLQKEYSRAVDEAERFEMYITKKFATSKDGSEENLSTVTDSLNEEIFTKDQEILALQERVRQLEQNQEELDHTCQELNFVKEKLLEERDRLEVALAEALGNHKISLRKIVELKKKVNELKAKQDELSAEHKESKQQKAVTNQEDNISVETNHMNLSVKLLRAVQMLIAEKCARQKAEEAKKQLEEERMTLKLQNETLNITNAHLQKKFELKQEDLLSITTQTSVPDDEALSQKNNIEVYQKRIDALKTQMDKREAQILQLQENIVSLEGKCASIEFQKCEFVLRVHEQQGKMQTLEIRNDELYRSIQDILRILLQMKEDGLIEEKYYTTIASSVQLHFEDRRVFNS